MNEALIANWNAVVPEDGIVICCGDFTLAHYSDKKEKKIGKDAYRQEVINDYIKLFEPLNGNILLLRGNHDIIPLTEEPIGKLIASVDKATVVVDGVKIYAEHYPCTAFNGDFQVFGHIHTLNDGMCYGIDGVANDLLRKNQYDVGVDQNGYKPISYWELMQIFRKRMNNK